MMSETYVKAAKSLRRTAQSSVRLAREFPRDEAYFMKEAARLRDDVRYYLDRARQERWHEAQRAARRSPAHARSVSL